MTHDPARPTFDALVKLPDAAIGLAQAALLIAEAFHQGLDIRHYLQQLDQHTDRLQRHLLGSESVAEKQQALNRYLFEDQGFARTPPDFQDPNSSFLNSVLDSGRGLPILLSLVYIEIGRRIGIPLEGVSFPGHFLVKYQHLDDEIILDPFSRGLRLNERDLLHRLEQLTQKPLEGKPDLTRFLVAADKRSILIRILRNLKGLYLNKQQYDGALIAIDRILAISPNSAADIRDRGQCFEHLECARAAAMDYQRYLELATEAHDRHQIHQRHQEMKKRAALLN